MAHIRHETFIPFASKFLRYNSSHNKDTAQADAFKILGGDTVSQNVFHFNINNKFADICADLFQSTAQKVTMIEEYGMREYITDIFKRASAA